MPCGPPIVWRHILGAYFLQIGVGGGGGQNDLPTLLYMSLGWPVEFPPPPREFSYICSGGPKGGSLKGGSLKGGHLKRGFHSEFLLDNSISSALSQAIPQPKRCPDKESAV